MLNSFTNVAISEKGTVLEKCIRKSCQQNHLRKVHYHYLAFQEWYMSQRAPPETYHLQLGSARDIKHMRNTCKIIKYIWKSFFQCLLCDRQPCLQKRIIKRHMCVVQEAPLFSNHTCNTRGVLLPIIQSMSVVEVP